MKLPEPIQQKQVKAIEAKFQINFPDLTDLLDKTIENGQSHLDWCGPSLVIVEREASDPLVVESWNFEDFEIREVELELEEQVKSISTFLSAVVW